VSQHNPDRARRNALHARFVDLPLGAHLALGGLALLLIAATISDFGTHEMLTAAYFAAIMYGAINLCHGYLREHAPAQPRRLQVLPLLAFSASTVMLTVYFRHATGAHPMELTPTTATVATGVFLLLFAAFLDAITNRANLKRSRDPKRPYAGLPRWTPTWRAATLPLVMLIGVAHAGSLGYIEPVTVTLSVVLISVVHVGSLVFAGPSRAAAAPPSS
jgi:hypothetical protein